MKISRLLFYILFLVYFFSCSTNNDEQPTQSIDLELVNENDWEMSNNILNLINIHRASIGKSIIEKDTSYATAYAVHHSKYMETIDRVNHDNFFIRSTFLKEKGAVAVSENIAYAYSSAESVVNAWLKSDPHKEIIEGDFSHIGFGVIKSSNSRYYYTTIYYK